MGVEDHATGVEADGSIWVGGGIIQEFGACCCRMFGAAGLGRGDVVQCHQHGVVDGSSIVEEDADNLLDAFNALFGERG